MRKTRLQTIHPSVTVHQDEQQLSYRAATKLRVDHPHKKQRRREKSLRLLLAIDGGGSVGYAVLSFVGLHLFDFSDEGNNGKTTDQTAQLEEIKFPSGVDANIFGMGFCVSGSEVYLVGGQKAEKESSDSDYGGEDRDLPGRENPENQSCDSDREGKDSAPLPTYSPYDYSPSVFVVKFEDSQPLEVWEAPAMESGKASPLVVEVEKTIYALAGTPVAMVPKPAFEAYNIIRKEWEGLDSPRFLQPYSKYFQDPQFCSFAVIKKIIHVSTSRSSYSYHTERRKWSRSKLFDDAPPELRRPWVNVRYPRHFDWMNPLKSNKDEEKDYGLPFSFDGHAVLCGEDVLIGVVPSQGVVAYKLVDAKVKYYKSLEDLEIPTDSTSAYLVDFKEGYLCLVSFLDPDQAIEEGKSAISIKPFHIFKSRYDLRPKDENTKILNWSDDDNDKLDDENWIYKVGKSISPEFTDKIWNPLGCFAL